MRSPLEHGSWHVIEEVSSSQDVAAASVKQGEGGVFLVRNQTIGRGRFGRDWFSAPGDSLTMSMAFMAYPDHPRPYLIGMTVAVAAAALVRCELAWPNDLVYDGRKLGGLLTELVPDDRGRRIPVVGVGINLNQRSFPSEIAGFATSVALNHGGGREPDEIAEALVERLPRLPEPTAWADLAPVWDLFDHTPGKRYRTSDGREAVALGIGPDGALICSIAGETASIMVADALFGPAS